MRAHQLLLKAVFIAALLTVVPLGIAQAEVTVTSATPSSALQGTVSLDVEIAGSGFDSSAQVDFLQTGTANPGGITVKKVAVRGSKKLIATIDVADDATVTDFDVQVTLSGGRKGKGITLFKVQAKVTNANDPCADPNLDFPAFIYWQQNSLGWEMFVTDADARCTRSVVNSSELLAVDTAAFSYPVSGTANSGRVAWIGDDGRNYQRVIRWVDFTVDPASRSISLGNVNSIPLDWMADSLEMSKDGLNAFVSFSGFSTGELPSLWMIPLESAQSAQKVYEAQAPGMLLRLSASADGLTLAADEVRLGDGSKRLLKVNLPCSDPQACTTVMAGGPQYSAPFWPAVRPDGEVLASQEYLDGSGDCFRIRFQDAATAAPIYAGTQPRYGRSLTWLGGVILSDGDLPPDRRNRCKRTDSIVKIDPATGGQVVLIRGVAPDAR